MMLSSRKAPRPLCSVYSYPTKWFGGDGGGERRDQQRDKDRSRLQRARVDENRLGNRPDTRGMKSAPMVVRWASEIVIPYFLDGVKSGIETSASRSPVHRLENLLVRPLPWWKRVIDIAGAACGIGARIADDDHRGAADQASARKGPSIFTQQRAGLGGRPFTIYKFRTMVVDAEEQKAALRKLSEQDGPAFKLTQRPAHHARRPVPPQDEHRRAAAAVERAQGRHVARRPAPAAGRRIRRLRALAAPPPRRHARPDLHLAGQGPQQGHASANGCAWTSRTSAAARCGTTCASCWKRSRRC